MRIIGYDSTKNTANVELTVTELSKIDSALVAFEYSPVIEDEYRDKAFWETRERIATVLALLKDGGLELYTAEDIVRLINKRITKEDIPEETYLNEYNQDHEKE